MNSSLYLHCATPYFAEDTKCFRFSGESIYLAICRQFVSPPRWLIKTTKWILLTAARY